MLYVTFLFLLVRKTAFFTNFVLTFGTTTALVQYRTVRSCGDPGSRSGLMHLSDPGLGAVCAIAGSSVSNLIYLLFPLTGCSLLKVFKFSASSSSFIISFVNTPGYTLLYSRYIALEMFCGTLRCFVSLSV